MAYIVYIYIYIYITLKGLGGGGVSGGVLNYKGAVS